MMIQDENDGIYSTKNRKEVNVLVRLYCQSPDCLVNAKVIRHPAMLCLYTQHVHQIHHRTHQNGLRKPALRYVQTDADKPQQKLLQDLDQQGLYNSFWSDHKNKVAIKSAMQRAAKARPLSRTSKPQGLTSRGSSYLRM